MNTTIKRVKLAALLIAILMLSIMVASTALADQVSDNTAVTSNSETVNSTVNAPPAGSDDVNTGSTVSTNTIAAEKQTSSEDAAGNNDSAVGSAGTAAAAADADTNALPVIAVPDSTVTIKDVPPTANDQFVVVNLNNVQEIILTGAGADSDTLVFSVVAGPQNGIIRVNGSVVTYAPNEDYTGEDCFTFKVNNGKADSNIATVNILVNADFVGENPDHLTEFSTDITKALDFYYPN